MLLALLALPILWDLGGLCPPAPTRPPFPGVGAFTRPQRMPKRVGPHGRGGLLLLRIACRAAADHRLADLS